MKPLEILASLWKALLRPAQPAFNCGDCTRNASCGLEPSPNCLVRIAQMSTDRGKRRETIIGY